MKIKVVNLIWSMGDGGAQQILINYLRYFQNDPDIDFQLIVYTGSTNSKYDKEIIEKGYPVIYLNNPRTKIQIPYLKRFFQCLVSQKEWQKAIHKLKPDIVHVHISSLLRVTLPGIVKENVPIRFDTLHSSPYRYTGQEKRIISDSFRNHEFIPVCVTKEQFSQAKECFGIKKYEIVRNGVDFEIIKNNMCSRTEARDYFNIPDDRFVVIGVGRLNPIKNYSLLVKVFSELQKIRDNSILIFAGEGSEKKRLLHIAKEHGIENKVRFLGNLENVVPLYCAADVLAVTSLSESSSLVTLEAQICGLRCVLSDGVPKESIITSHSIKLERNASLELWVKALLDKDYRGKSECAKEDYEVHHVCKQMKDVYLKHYREKLKMKNGCEAV